MVTSSHTLDLKQKIGIVILLMIQMLRLCCVLSQFYNIYDVVIVKNDGSEIAAFDEIYCPCAATKPTMTMMVTNTITHTSPQQKEETNLFDAGVVGGQDYEAVYGNYDYDAETVTVKKEEIPAPAFNETFKISDVMTILGTALDITTCIQAILIITIPLSRSVGFRRWVKWIFRTRLIYMRMLWVVTAAVYATLYFKYRRNKYNKGREVKDYDNELVITILVLIPIEYACLGLLETVSRIYTATRVNEKLKRTRVGLPKTWGMVVWVTYLLALIDFALRNFSVSFYFGLYSVILADAGADSAKNVTIVLQVYLAIMRGKFFQFFLRLFLSNYFFEDDDEQFNLPSKGKPRENGDENIVPADVDKSTDEDDGDKYAQWFDREEGSQHEKEPLKA